MSNSVINNAATFLNKKSFWNISSFSEAQQDIRMVLENHLSIIKEDASDEDFEKVMESIVSEWETIQETYNIPEERFQLMMESSLLEFWPAVGGALRNLAPKIGPAVRSGASKFGEWLKKGKSAVVGGFKGFLDKFRKPKTPEQAPKSPKSSKVGPESPEKPPETTPKSPTKAPETAPKVPKTMAPKKPSVLGPALGGAAAGVLGKDLYDKTKSGEQQGAKAAETSAETAKNLEQTARDLLTARNKHTGIDSNIDSTIDRLKADKSPEKTMQNFVDMQKRENKSLGVPEK